MRSIKNKKGWLFFSLMGGCYLSYQFASFYKELGSIPGVTICGVVCAVLFVVAIVSLLLPPQKFPPGSEPERLNKSNKKTDPVTLAPVKKMENKKKNNKGSKSELDPNKTNPVQELFFITEYHFNYKKNINIINIPALSKVDDLNQTKEIINPSAYKVSYLLTIHNSQVLQNSNFSKSQESINFSLN